MVPSSSHARKEMSCLGLFLNCDATVGKYERSVLCCVTNWAYRYELYSVFWEDDSKLRSQEIGTNICHHPPCPIETLEWEYMQGTCEIIPDSWHNVLWWLGINGGWCKSCIWVFLGYTWGSNEWGRFTWVRFVFVWQWAKEEKNQHGACKKVTCRWFLDLA